MVRAGVVIALVVMSGFVAMGYYPFFDCPHPAPDQHWCALIARLKRAFAPDDPGPFFACANCRDEGRVTLVKKLYGRTCCEVLTK